jgi:hypothetical protein
MKPKRQLNKRIRGWFPQEPASSLSSNGKVRVKTNPISIGVVSARAIGGLGLGCFLSGFALLSVPYFLFPSSYTPKANSAWGYSEPATVEAWIVLGAAIGLIFLSVFAFALLGVKLKSQGSKWMKYTYWITPEQDGYRGKTLFKVTVATNIALVGAFIVFTVYAAVMGLIELRFQSMIIFSVLLALVNLFLHEYGKKRADKQRRNPQNEH